MKILRGVYRISTRDDYYKNLKNRYWASTYCKICTKPKTKYLNMTQIAYLPESIKSAAPNTKIMLG